MLEERSSLSHTRYRCFQSVRKNQDEYFIYVSLVDSQCEWLQLSEMTADQFKCLVFVCGVMSSVDADIRTRILFRIETDLHISLQSVSGEYQRIASLKHDIQLVSQLHRD